MLSIYSSAFNVVKNCFDYEKSIDRFCNFADEVVIAVNKSEDATVEKFLEIQSHKANLKIIETNFSYEDPLLDGRIKNEALQSTSNDVKVGLDLDEYIPLNQKQIWTDISKLLISNDQIGCVMIPSLNLYKSDEYYSTIGLKWYLHKGGFRRGAVNFARNADGTIDTSKSDTCELIDQFGDLVPSIAFKNSIEALRSGLSPFVVHTGYVDLEKRITRNKNFWIKHWRTESGGIDPTHKVHRDISEFDESHDKHLLKI